MSDREGISSQRASGPFTCAGLQGHQREGQGLRTLRRWGRRAGQMSRDYLAQAQVGSLLTRVQAQGWRVSASPQPLGMPPPQPEAKGPILWQAGTLGQIMPHCPI